MRIKVTIIEATADDLRQSKSLSDAFTNAFRNAFAGMSIGRLDVDEDRWNDKESRDESGAEE